MNSTVVQIALKALGTAALAICFVFIVARAPFLTDSADISDNLPQAVQTKYPTPSDLQVDTGALNSPMLPELPKEANEDIGLPPSLGLFNASFASVNDDPGFVVAEHRIPGPCSGAGLRFFESECPMCELIGGDNARESEMLVWHQLIESRKVIRAVSRNCTSVASDNEAIVGTLQFGDGPVDFSEKSTDLAKKFVPLLPGATRIASIKLGAWFATYDEVPRPSTALSDMALALSSWGWREVSDPGASKQDDFQGQRVFTNSVNATCVISLTKQDDIYQLLTVINSRA